MRLLSLAASLCMLTLVACGDDPKPTRPDASLTNIDGGADAGIDGAPPIDGPVDSAGPTASEQIAAVRAATDGTTLMLPIEGAVVTYVKPLVGNATNDPAGFTIQAAATGPALFVSVDPATLTPVPVAGDTVSFSVTSKVTVGGSPRASVITGFTRTAQGFNVSTLAQNISAATDLLTAQANYDAELITVTGTVFGPIIGSGTGWSKLGANTAGMTTSDPNLQVRLPATLMPQVDLEAGCQFTITNTPFSTFVTQGGIAQSQLIAFDAQEVTTTNCPTPKLTSAVGQSATELRLTFSRNILASSVMADASQFTFDNGLLPTAVAVDARTITITTTPQVAGTTYTVTVANTVTDQNGVGLDPAATSTMFSGYAAPAVVRINEINANITGGCDLIELRVIGAGSMNGFKITERAGSAATDLNFDFPAFVVQKNDLIVVHVNSGFVNCNPGAATSETLSTIQQPAVTYAANYDTAFDIYVADAGLVATDNVITVFATSTIMDGVLVHQNDVDPLTAAGSETAAATLAAANQWQMVGGGTPVGGFLDADFQAHAVFDLDATGTTAAGTSIQRNDNDDVNDKADWNAANTASTWGVLNVGQTTL
ncbi:MAG: Ig-like domain-containing protein [Deltaproteobacteria bacterium]|nr:Ig-like domain-containing protein [Deltaproteobacteria bacterium]